MTKQIVTHLSLDQLPVEIILRILDLLDDFYDFRNLSLYFPNISEIIKSEVHHFVIHERLNNSVKESAAGIRLKRWLNNSILGNHDSELIDSKNVTLYDIDYTDNRKKAVCSFHPSFLDRNSEFSIRKWDDLVKCTDRDYSTYYRLIRQYERTVNNEFESNIYPEFLDNHKYRELFQEIVKKSKGKRFITIIFDTGTHSIILNMAMALKYMFLERQEIKMKTPFSLISLKNELSGDWYFLDGVDLSQNMICLFDYLVDIDIKLNSNFNEIVYDTFSDFSGFDRRLYINNMVRDILRPNELDYYATNDFKAFEKILNLNNIYDKSKVKPFLQCFINSILLKQIRKVQSKYYNNPLKADLHPSLVNENDYLDAFRSMDIVFLRNLDKLNKVKEVAKGGPKPILFESFNELEENITKFVSYYKCLIRMTNLVFDTNDMIMIDGLITKETMRIQRKVHGFYSFKLKEIRHLLIQFDEIGWNMPWLKNKDLELRIRLFKGTNCDFHLVKKKLKKRFHCLFEELQEIQRRVCSEKNKLGCGPPYTSSWLLEQWKRSDELLLQKNRIINYE